MKTKKLPLPLNNNVLVRRLEKPKADDLVKDKGIFVPAGATASTACEEVEIIAVSPDIFAGQLNAWVCPVKAGQVALIHRGVNGTPIKYNGEEYLVVGYVNLVAVLP
jgi:co-chaperonin GroES (HSP10)